MYRSKSVYYYIQSVLITAHRDSFAFPAGASVSPMSNLRPLSYIPSIAMPSPHP